MPSLEFASGASTDPATAGSDISSSEESEHARESSGNSSDDAEKASDTEEGASQVFRALVEGREMWMTKNQRHTMA